MRVARIILWDTEWPRQTQIEILNNIKAWCRECILLRIEAEQIEADISKLRYFKYKTTLWGRNALQIEARLDIDIMKNLKILTTKELQDLWESKRNIILLKAAPTKEETNELLVLRKELDRRKGKPLPTTYVDFEKQVTD